jgi:nicotinamide-nucleotide amidase
MLALESGRTVGVAESLTGGMISTSLAAGERASEWFRGAVVAYAGEVKFGLLDVPRGPVVSEQTARAMAEGARKLLDADVVVSATGVGGPEPSAGEQPGSVWLAVATADGTTSVHEQFDAPDPAGVCSAAVRRALELVEQALTV